MILSRQRRWISSSATKTRPRSRDARRLGDARRGALVFYQPALTCTRCHVNEKADAPAPTLGPDLAAIGKDTAARDLIESILEPSKVIKKGYEPVTIATDDGRTIIGLLVEERPEAVVLRDPAQDGKPVTIARDRIEGRRQDGPSLMPAGLVNALASRQQFLDLLRYLMEIAEYGPARARALRPDPALVAPPLPEYEHQLDHAGLIAGLGSASLRRGEAIYARVCANCHGTQDRPGSLPNAPRFASATLKNGSDPYSLYRTITDGFGQMAPQSWMVPRQKYDVIHYIRETFFKPHNPRQYLAINRAYLDGLPRGTTRGPAPSEIEPWVAMDYGSCLLATVEAGDDLSNVAYKGIAVRLDAGQGGVSRGRAWVLYEHDTLRLAAAWTGQGFIDWKGINFNGQHQVHPRLVGKVHVANPDGPGWADPDDPDAEDRRILGRDGRRYGPLPSTWARYRGLYRHGDRVVLAYTVGAADVLETPGLEIDPAQPGVPIFTRTLEIGPSTVELSMRVASPKVSVSLAGDRAGARLSRRDGSIVLSLPPSGTSRVLEVLMSGGGPKALETYAAASPAPEPPGSFTHGGPRRWPEVLKTQAVIGRDDGPFAVDVLTLPDSNPWLCQMRPSGFDFLPGGQERRGLHLGRRRLAGRRARRPGAGLTWRRIASGLFQPLGLKIVDGQIYVGCRDQVVRLRDLNGDGETDFYECFNSDHQVTEHFHEFAMGLQVDAEGNFYYAKAARHGLKARRPAARHAAEDRQGRRADRDPGDRLPCPQRRLPQPRRHLLPHRPGRILAPQEPDQLGQEGRLLRQHVGLSRCDRPIRRRDGAAGLLDHQCLRPLAGRAGAGRERPNGLGAASGLAPEPLVRQRQGLRGAARGRRRPDAGRDVPRCRSRRSRPASCGAGSARPTASSTPAALFAWAGDRTQPGGFYRVRATGKPMYVPVGLHARKDGMAITFTDRLDRKAASDPKNYTRQDVVAEADGQLRLRPHRRAAGAGSPPRRSPTTAGPCSSRSPRSGRPGAWRSPTRSAASPASPSRVPSTTRSTDWGSKGEFHAETQRAAETQRRKDRFKITDLRLGMTRSCAPAPPSRTQPSAPLRPFASLRGTPSSEPR